MSELLEMVEAEVRRPPPEPIRATAAELAGASGGVAAVLFYGSALRAGEADTLLDFYVLVDGYRTWPAAGPVQAGAGALLPPNVEHRSFRGSDGRVLGAKVAVVRTDQFERAVRRGSLDTTFWARFAQPVMLAWSRDEDARARVVAALAEAVRTAAGWAAVLGPEQGRPTEYWTTLFRETYAAELRVERGDRAASIVAAQSSRYEGLLLPAWRDVGLHQQPTDAAGRVAPGLNPDERRRERRRWRLRRLLGRPLNAARLIKAAFTFRGGADYLAWKIQRHTATPVPLTDWQRRHPILAAPGVYRKLKRQGVIR